MNFKSAAHDKMEQKIKQKLIYSLDFNISGKGTFIDGNVAVSETNLWVFKDGVETFCGLLSAIDEYQIDQLVGSGSLKIVEAGKETQLCIFTQDKLIEFAELVKMLEFHGDTGVFSEPDEEAVSVKQCPKCHSVFPEGTELCFHCAHKGKYLWRIAKLSFRYKGALIAAFLATLIMQLLWIVFTYMKGLVVDQYISSGSQDYMGLLGMMSLYLLIPVILFGVEFVNERCSSHVAMSVGRDLRQILFDKIQAQSMRSALKRPAGEQINRIAHDTEKVQEFVAFHGKEAIVRLFSMAIILTVMALMNWKLTFWIILPILVGIVAAQFIFQTINRRYRLVWNNFSKSESALHDILNGILVVKVFGKEQHEINHYGDCSKRFANAMYHAEQFWFLVFPILGFIITLGEYFYLYFGGNAVLSNTLTFGEMVIFLSYIGLLYGPLHWLIQLPKFLAETAVSAGKIFEIIDQKEDVLDENDPLALTIEGNVSFEHVDFGYKVYKPVLRDICFEAKKGEMIGIVGASGVGKSTLINLIMRLYDVSGGTLSIDGVNIRNIAQHSLRSQIGVVLQETYLFDGSVWDNLIYAKPDATMEEVVQAAKIANAHDFICKMPDAYQEYIGNRGYKLSGGEKQRIAIARAVLRDPRILILDEATSSLDTETEKMIQDALKNLTQNRTTFAIAHRLSTLRNANRLIVLDKGRIAEMGTHEELLRHKSVYYNLVMAQRQTSKLSKEAV